MNTFEWCEKWKLKLNDIWPKKEQRKGKGRCENTTKQCGCRKRCRKRRAKKLVKIGGDETESKQRKRNDNATVVVVFGIR